MPDTTKDNVEPTAPPQALSLSAALRDLALAIGKNSVRVQGWDRENPPRAWEEAYRQYFDTINAIQKGGRARFGLLYDLANEAQNIHGINYLLVPRHIWASARHPGLFEELCRLSDTAAKIERALYPPPKVSPQIEAIRIEAIRANNARDAKRILDSATAAAPAFNVHVGGDFQGNLAIGNSNASGDVTTNSTPATAQVAWWKSVLTWLVNNIKKLFWKKLLLVAAGLLVPVAGYFGWHKPAQKPDQPKIIEPPPSSAKPGS